MITPSIKILTPLEDNYVRGTCTDHENRDLQSLIEFKYDRVRYNKDTVSKRKQYKLKDGIALQISKESCYCLKHHSALLWHRILGEIPALPFILLGLCGFYKLHYFHYLLMIIMRLHPKSMEVQIHSVSRQNLIQRLQFLNTLVCSYGSNIQ